jgi:hypothetical protein
MEITERRFDPAGPAPARPSSVSRPSGQRTMKPRRAAFGSWASPLGADSRHGRDSHPAAPPRRRRDHWLELRPDEGGRTVLMQDLRGRRTELTPRPSACAAGSTSTAAAATASRDRMPGSSMTRTRRSGTATPGDSGASRPADRRRYADLVRDPVAAAAAGRVRGPRRRRRAGELARRDRRRRRVTTLLSRARTSTRRPPGPRGRAARMAGWNHPHLPWDGTELWVAALDADGRPGDPRAGRGRRAVSVFQPEWLRDGRLGFVADPTAGGITMPGGRAADRAPHRDGLGGGLPQWVFGQSTWGEVAGGCSAP